LLLAVVFPCCGGPPSPRQTFLLATSYLPFFHSRILIFRLSAQPPLFFEPDTPVIDFFVWCGCAGKAPTRIYLLFPLSVFGFFEERLTLWFCVRAIMKPCLLFLLPLVFDHFSHRFNLIFGILIIAIFVLHFFVCFPRPAGVLTRALHGPSVKQISFF